MPSRVNSRQVFVSSSLAQSELPLLRRRSPFARQEPLHRTRILPKPRRLRRFSISDARFALFNIKRDIARKEKCKISIAALGREGEDTKPVGGSRSQRWHRSASCFPAARKSDP